MRGTHDRSSPDRDPCVRRNAVAGLASSARPAAAAPAIHTPSRLPDMIARPDAGAAQSGPRGGVALGWPARLPGPAWQPPAHPTPARRVRQRDRRLAVHRRDLRRDLPRIGERRPRRRVRRGPLAAVRAAVRAGRDRRGSVRPPHRAARLRPLPRRAHGRHGRRRCDGRIDLDPRRPRDPRRLRLGVLLPGDGRLPAGPGKGRAAARAREQRLGEPPERELHPRSGDRRARPRLRHRDDRVHRERPDLRVHRRRSCGPSRRRRARDRAEAAAPPEGSPPADATSARRRRPAAPLRRRRPRCASDPSAGSSSSS